MQITYTIFPDSPESHLFNVRCLIQWPEPTGQVVSLPAWIPGSYMIRDFAKNVVSFEASCEGKPVPHTKLDKDTWQLSPVKGELLLEYQVYALDLSVRSAHLDNTHGFFNGTSVFVRVHGQEEQACQVNILPPQDPKYKHWRLATSMQSLQAPLKHSDDQCQFGEYSAKNYMDLIEHPVEMGDFDWFGFKACGVPHYVALTGQHHADKKRLAADLKVICEHHIHFFGEPAPVDRYVFLVMITGDGYGGLEHTHSTALLTSRKSLPLQQDKQMSNGYREFLGLCSHEYFHTWNIKRLKPAEFIKMDLQKENYTRQLWAYEGITSYYDDLSLLRCGLISLDSYLELLGKTLTRLQQSLGRHKQTVTESSFDAWTKFYKQDENAINAIVSYYTKGAVIALLLDLKLRQLTPFSLDQVMRQLWQSYLTQGDNYAGTEDEQIFQAINNLIATHVTDVEAQSLHNQIKSFLAQLLDTREELPIQELLASIGINLTVNTAYLKKAAADSTQTSQLASLGVRFKTDRVTGGNFPKITHIYNKSAAEKAGLSPGDSIVSLDGIKAQMPDFEEQIRNLSVGQTVSIYAFRRDELMQFNVTLQQEESTVASLSLDESNTTGAQVRAKWQM